MLFRFQSVYPLTDVALSGMSHVEQVSRLIDGGATLIQLREKKLSTREFYEQAKQAVTLARSRGARIIINDRVDLGLSVGADGVHLGPDDLPPEMARALLGPDALIGYSTHSVHEAEKAVKLSINYLAIGPVFSTNTKSDTAPLVGLEGVRAVKQVAGQLPVVAIGGISEEQLPAVLAAGADSAAVISAVFCKPFPIDVAMYRLLTVGKQI